MNDIKLVHQDDTIDYKTILFERPISRLHAKHIGIVVGKDVNLLNLNKLHKVITDFKYDQHIIADNTTKSLGIPAELFLSSQNKKSIAFQNTDTALDILSNCNYSIVGLGFDGSSKMQLFIEKMIEYSNTALVMYPKCIEIFKTSQDILNDREDDVIFCNLDSLKKMIKYLRIDNNFSTNYSVMSIASILADISKRLKCNIVFYNDNQILFSNFIESSLVGIINFDTKYINRFMNEFVAIFVCLLCDSRNKKEDVMVRFLTAGYLLKIYIDSYSEFKLQLS